MKLEEYMKMRKMSIRSLAEFLKLPYLTVWLLLTHRRRPSLDSAIEIELLTKRQVRCIDWRKEPVIIPKAKRKVDLSPKKIKKRQKTNETKKD